MGNHPRCPNCASRLFVIWNTIPRNFTCSSCQLDFDTEDKDIKELNEQDVYKPDLWWEKPNKPKDGFKEREPKSKRGLERFRTLGSPGGTGYDTMRSLLDDDRKASSKRIVDQIKLAEKAVEAAKGCRSLPKTIGEYKKCIKDNLGRDGYVEIEGNSLVDAVKCKVDLNGDLKYNPDTIGFIEETFELSGETIDDMLKMATLYLAQYLVDGDEKGDWLLKNAILFGKDDLKSGRVVVHLDFFPDTTLKQAGDKS